MRKMLFVTFFAALAAPAVGSASTAARPVTAATQASAPVHLATIMCGSNGCARVHTRAPQRRKFQTLGHG